MKRYNSPFFTDDKIYSFVDGRTTAEEDKLFIARMAKDKDFANMIEDLMDAVNPIAESDKAEIDTSFDYSRAAIAAFCDNDVETSDNASSDITTNALTTHQAKDLADDFLNSLEDSKPEDK